MRRGAAPRPTLVPPAAVPRGWAAAAAARGPRGKMVWAAGAGRVAAATAESRMVAPVAPAGLPRPGGRSGAGGTCRGPAASSARAAAPRGLGRFGDRRPEEAAWAQGGRAPPFPPPLAGSGRVRGQSVPRGRERGRALSGALRGRAGRHGRSGRGAALGGWWGGGSPAVLGVALPAWVWSP